MPTCFRPIAGDRLVTIENGIDLAKFADAAAAVPTRTILSYGRFAKHKRVHLLFPLLAALRVHDPAWRLIVAGREADATLSSLREAAEAAGVADAVRFAIDPSNDELRSLMGEASYYASASEHEGFGIAAVEAMSAGLVPLLSEIGPFRRLVERTGVGISTDMRDPVSAAAAISARAAGPQAREAAERAVAGMGWDAAGRRYAAAYAFALAKAQAPTAVSPAE